MGIVDQITQKGQPFVDEPIFAQPKDVPILEESIAAAFGRSARSPRLTIGHERIALRWLRPDGRGGLVEK